MAMVMDSAGASLAAAKAALIEAAPVIDPLAPLRRHPFITVGVAAAVGAILGMDQGRLMTSVSLARRLSSLARLLAAAVGQYVIAKTR